MPENKSVVLITGAAGFIGSHLVDAVLARGDTVLGVDNLLTGRKENLTEALKNPNFSLIEADVTKDPSSYLPQDITIKTVFHLASPASPPRYQAKPVETYLVNSYGTHLLLQYLKTSSPEASFVFASTSEVYGDPKEHPQKESYWGNVNPNGIRSCYDEAKRLGETICGVHARDFGMNVRIVRIFNTYGPRMDPEDGRVIPDFFMQALKGQPITVYGEGNQTRSFCYVSDLVEGLLALAENPSAKGATINLGNPTEKTMLELAEIVKGMCASQSPVEHKPLPADDPKQRKPDLTLANTILNWEPKISFEDGLAKTLAYFKSL